MNISTTEYMRKFASELDKIPYFPTIKQLATINKSSNISLLDYLNFIDTNNPWLSQYLDLTKYSVDEWRAIYEELNTIDTGGFGDGETGSVYGKEQTKPRYFLSRSLGYTAIAKLVKPDSSVNFTKNDIVVDLLAGNGTLTRILNDSLGKDNCPTLIGSDVSEMLVADSFTRGEITIRGFAHKSLIASNIAHGVVCANGSHHIPIDQRSATVEAASNILKKKGKFVLHDFEEGTATARWYSEIINTYRIGGHDYKHFTKNEMFSLLNPYFDEVNVFEIYDPFCLRGIENQSDEELKIDFYKYLIKLYTLRKLLPEGTSYQDLDNYSEKKYWDNIAQLFAPYFTHTLDNKQLLNLTDQQGFFQAPLVNEITIIDDNGEKCLIAPRFSLVATGISKK